MPTTLELTLILLSAGVFVVAGLKAAGLPALLGYVLIGIGLGPFLPHVEHESPTARLAEFGVVFLMFSIGLEFSLSRLRSMRQAVFGLGGLQVGVTMFVVMALGLLLGLPWEAGLALGGVLAMSSTAVVSKLLAERDELGSDHGRLILGILLFQDLAVAPLIIFVPALAKSGGMGEAMLLATLKASLALVLILALGQRLMRPWFQWVAQAKSGELFMLNVLLVTLGLAYITDQAGLSLALGAFLAGVLIAETEYRYQVESDIRPFRDVLMGLFFVTVGLMLDLRVVAGNWMEVFGVLALLILGKGLVIGLLTGLFTHSWPVVARVGLSLAQAGEFGFVLLGLTAGNALIGRDLHQTILAAMVLSMLVAPGLFLAGAALARRLEGGAWMEQAREVHEIAARAFGKHKHVILCGYGRSGQNLARMLETEQVPFIALDDDPRRVHAAAQAGDAVVFGDATRAEVLMAAGVHRARAVVVSFAHTPSALQIISAAHRLKPDAPVIVRTVDESSLDQLRQAGAAEVVPEVMEGALMLASQTLLMAGVPLSRVLKRIRHTREARYGALRGYFRGLTDEDEDARGERLASILLGPGFWAAGRRLAELSLSDLGVDLVSLRRYGQSGMGTDPETVLREGDVLVLRGEPETLSAAELRLSQG
ncbi:MAG TPA: cation:proton antiporter [Thiobacillaceae bacterium]|nr:cation:proton antiporter [Thiobacillaceae bacterium]HNU64238.1 cation:proton antiporter [Thiobacillaceae bacterium]